MAEALRSDIVAGRLGPGDPLPPIGICKARRRAYRILTAEGLVQHVNGRGMFVAGAAPRSGQAVGFEREVAAVADSLRSDIAAGVLAPGSSVAIRAQARRIPASIRVTRQALQRLTGAGLVELVPGRGLFVAGGNPADATKVGRVVQWMRAMIASGVFEPGDELPTQRELCARLGVGESVVGMAFRELKRSNEIVALSRGHAVSSAPSSDRSSSGEHRVSAQCLRSRSTVDLIAEDLRHAVANTMAPGDKFPTYDEVAARRGSSRSSVARAFSLLRKENLVVSQHGGGVFVADTPEVARLRLRSGRRC